MPTFVALLRGVNVGKARRVPMEAFRGVLSGLGHSGVKTLLNSGNAVFNASGTSAPAHAGAIARAIQDHLGIDVPVVVRSARHFAAIVDENPFAATAQDHSRLLVAFCQTDDELSALAPIEALVTPPEAFAIGRHAAYLHCAAGILESKAGKALLGKAGRTATTRNWATTLKLNAMAGAAGPG